MRNLGLFIVVALCVAAATLPALNHSCPSLEKADLVFPDKAKLIDVEDELVEDRQESLADFDRMKAAGVIPAAAEPPELSLERLKLEFSRRWLIASIEHDESQVFTALSRMNPSELDFNPRFFLYGGGYIYCAGAALKVAQLAGQVELEPDLQHYFRNPEHMERVYVVVRLLSVAGVLASLVVVVLIGRILGETRAGVLAALFFGLTPAVVVWAHLAKPHLWGTFWMLLSLAFILQVMRSGKLRWYVLAGAAGGFAAGTMYLYGLVLALLPIAHLIGWRSQRKAGQTQGRALVVPLLGAAAAAALVFFLANPYLPFSIRDLVVEVRDHNVLVSRFDAPFAEKAWLFLRAVTFNVFGPVLTVLFLGRLVYVIVRGPAAERLLGGFAVVFLGAGAVFFWAPHYVVPIVALVALMAARAVFAMARRRDFWRLFGTAVAAVAVLWGALHIVFYDELYKEADRVRVEAGSWINEHIPTEASGGVARLRFGEGLPPFSVMDRDIVEIQNDTDLLSEEKPLYYVYGQDIGEDALVRSEVFRDEYVAVKGFGWNRSWLRFLPVRNELILRAQHDVVIYRRKIGRQ